MRNITELYYRLKNNERIVLLGTMWASLIRAMGMGITYISLILLARWMGAEQFGIYAYVFSVISTLAIVPLFGLSYSSIPLIAEYEVDKKFAELRGLLLFGTGFVVAVSVIVSFAFAMLIMADIIGLGEYRDAILIGCIALPAFSLLSYLGEVSRGLGRAIAAFAPLQVLVPLIFLLLAFISFYLFDKLEATRTIWLWFFAMLALVIPQALYLLKIVVKRFPELSRNYHVRQWLKISAQFFLISIAVVLLFQMDVLILGMFHEPEIVGYYSAAARTALLVTIILQAINALGARQYATLYKMNKTDELQQLLHSLSRWLVWATAGVTVFLLLGGHYLLAFFGNNFTQAYPALAILTVAYAATVILGPVTVLLNVTGNQKVTAKVLTTAVVIGIILNSILIPIYGMVGAAIAAGTMHVFWAISLHRHVRKILGVETCLFFMKSSAQHKGKK
ncbi:hypothetical protein MNBD_GAMMA23-1536 [hydrothermal vent metagenome]|uniref:Uncharacterized protein n=1 Tax=hydrothermal vent metagenome TaxID=652676 RepID=A0A3B1AAB0_9ZZZZ